MPNPLSRRSAQGPDVPHFYRTLAPTDQGELAGIPAVPEAAMPNQNHFASMLALLMLAGALGCTHTPTVYDTPVQYATATAPVDATAYADAHACMPRRGGPVGKIVSDHCAYYSPEHVACMAAAFGVGATLAHTDVDQDLRNSYQWNVRSNSTDDAARVAKMFGEGEYIVAAAGAAWAVGSLCDETYLGDLTGQWGDRTLRGLIVGTPPMLLMQATTGGSRPEESTAESDWVPFHDSNGVSGHTYMGAVPFITAAQMSDRPGVKAACYTASILPGLSRINDDNHYTSQVVLGWWMAYMACRSVDCTERQESWYEPTPTVTSDGTVGMGIVIER